MHPDIARFSIFTINSYSLLLAAAFLAGAWLAERRASRAGIDPRRITALSIYIFLAAIGGARIAWGLLHAGSFPANLFDVYRGGVLRMDGLVMNGGIFGALAAIVLYARLRHLRLARLLDVIAPSFLAGMALTRIGCFLNGCCYGHPTGLPWGVVFPAASPAGQYERSLAASAVPLHPVQLYNAAAGVAILMLLGWVERHARPAPGAIASWALVLYGLSRFALEFLRPDSSHTLWLGLNHNQYTSLIIVLAGAGGWIQLCMRPAAGQSRAPATIPIEGAPSCHYSSI